MQRLDTVATIRPVIAEQQRRGSRVGLIPTMGALHEGHFSLIRAARSECDTVAVSIFVNPTQFGPTEDYQRYPRPIEADLAGCEREGVDVVFTPAVEEMYPGGGTTFVQVGPLGSVLCGAYRPGHFQGVATVVAKLFNIVGPDVAYFGQKDYQQTVIIRRMVEDLNFPLRVAVCPTVREPDGLALSSRNAYLSADERRQATSLSKGLFWARDEIGAGRRDAIALMREVRKRIEAAGPCRIDYIECVGAEDLIPRGDVDRPCALVLAVRIGTTRLIDNVLVGTASSD